MPRCWLKKQIYLGHQWIDGASPAILLKEGDRFSVIDPANNNELIRGMTKSFLATLQTKGLLTVEDV